MNEERRRELAADCAELAAMLAPAIENITAKLAPILADLYEACAQAITFVGENLVIQSDAFIEIYAVAQGVPLKWLYIYRHTKKRRTRKKYAKLLTDAAIAYMEESK